MLTSQTRSNLSYGSIFMMLWCVMIIAEYDNFLSWHTTPYHVLSVLAAYTGLFFARSKYVISVVLLTQIAVCLKLMPVVANHWFFAMVISGTLLIPLLSQIIHDRFDNAPVDPDYLKKAFPVVRLLTIVMYYFAVFHKLNADFFDPQLSCAVHIYQKIVGSGCMLPLPQQPELWFRYLLIYGTLLIELAIPVLLMLRRTWFAGIIVGGVFHLATGMLIRHFPTLMFVLFFLFIPVGAAKPLTQKFDTLIRRLTQDSFGIMGALVLQAAVFTVASILVLQHDTGKGIGFYLWAKEGHLSAMWPLLRLWGIMATVTFVMLIFFSTRHGYFHIHRARLFYSPWLFLYLIPVLYVVNCLSPYIGLKTSATMAMWSNLHTLNGQNNHLLLRGNRWKIFPYLDDMVEIVDTNVPGWRGRLVQQKRLIAFTMLKQMVQNQVRYSRGRVYIEYIRNGRRYSVNDAAWDAELMAPNPYWFRKCVYIRTSPRGAARECSW